MVDFKADFRPMQKHLDNFAKKQIPFATAQALTQTAKAAAANTKRQLPSIFDKPTPFTMNSIGVQAATKSSLEARVFIKDKQAEYLQLQEAGGARHPKKAAIVIPQGVRLNPHGNLPRNALAALKARKDVFAGTVRGVGGFWKRPARGKRRDGSYGTIGAVNAVGGFMTRLLLLVSFKGKTSYKPIFGFKAKTLKAAQAAAPVEFRKALERALRTMK